MAMLISEVFVVLFEITPSLSNNVLPLKYFT